MSAEFSGSITIFGSNTDLSGTCPLNASITALSDVVSASIDFWKLNAKPTLDDDEYIDVAGNRSGNNNIIYEYEIEGKDLDLPNKDYVDSYHTIVSPLRKRYKWLLVSDNYMYKLVNPNLSTPSDRSLAVHLSSIEDQISDSGKIYYDLTFKDRK